jgi:hypothetical protein
MVKQAITGVGQVFLVAECNSMICYLLFYNIFYQLYYFTYIVFIINIYRSTRLIIKILNALTKFF